MKLFSYCVNSINRLVTNAEDEGIIWGETSLENCNISKPSNWDIYILCFLQCRSRIETRVLRNALWVDFKKTPGPLCEFPAESDTKVISLNY